MIGTLRIELSQYNENNLIPTITQSFTSLSDDLATESVADMKEKLKKLEFELNSFKNNNNDNNNSSNGNNGLDIGLLQSEIEDLKRIKKERFVCYFLTDFSLSNV